MTTPEMARMLAAQTFAVVGASRRPEKYGFLMYHALKEAGKTTYAVNARAQEVDGDRCYAGLDALPQVPEVAVMVVPPPATLAAVAECARLGIGQVWMQPGAESEVAVRACHAANIAVVSGGPCLMVGLRTSKYTL